MDDLTYARRPGAVATVRPADPTDVETRFRTLVQSPLRAGILRYLSSRAVESFDIDSLMHAFGRLRLDVTTMPWEQVADAHRLIEERRHMGKLVLTI